MADLDQIRNTIERAASKRLGDQIEHLRREIVDEVLRELAPLLTSSGKAGGSPQEGSSKMLCDAVSGIQEAHSQADILKVLLEVAARFSARAALFVVRGTALAGWQARGFKDDNIRGLSIDASKGLAARAIQERAKLSGSATEFDLVFVQQRGNPHDSTCMLFPLVVKDKVAAILYCDSGGQPGIPPDYSGVDVLARFACLWLEHESGKKQAGSAAEPSLEASASIPSAPATLGPVPQTVKPSPVAGPAVAKVSPEEQEIHDKARRFAKLLVDEIKLYNQSKVAEGKQKRDLYKLLREDIEKSRATYDKRYGGTPAAAARYFDSEVIRILADNDRSLLGSDFPG
ncbi:MAG TPA: hypothetical protein VM912_04830 [Terriglobales bacterium]|nr:hypothetical protein [Terriglobales bacterium]